MGKGGTEETLSNIIAAAECQMVGEVENGTSTTQPHFFLLNRIRLRNNPPTIRTIENTRSD